MEDVARKTQNGSVPLEERDPDTIIVASHGARKRRRQDSGVHLDDETEGFAVNKEDSSGKGRGNSATEPSCFQPSSGTLTKAGSPASNEDPSPNYGSCSKQHLMEADQTVLLPLETLKTLQNEVQELRSRLLMLESRTQKQPDLFDDALDARLASPEVETGSSDNSDDGFDEAWLEDKAARKVAVKRVRRLAQEHHNGEQRAHLEFMADIVGVNHKSKLSIGHSIRRIPDPKTQAYVRQRLLEDYVAQLWRHTYEGSFAKPDFVALGEDVERLFD